MRRVFSCFNFYIVDLLRGRKYIRLLSVLIAVLIVFAALMPLQGQSIASPASNSRFLGFSERGGKQVRESPALHSTRNLAVPCHKCAAPYESAQEVSPSSNETSVPSANSDRSPENPSSSGVVAQTKHSDIYRDVYYRNRLEFALDVGYLPINIPFVFDVFLGDSYNMTPLRYTLVPVVASLRWHITDVDGPWILRGNWDMSCSGSVTAIPRGPESHYFSYDMGIRRNFVPRRGKIAPLNGSRTYPNPSDPSTAPANTTTRSPSVAPG